MIQSKEFYANSVVWEICISCYVVFLTTYTLLPSCSLLWGPRKKLEFENSFYYYLKIPIIMGKNVRRGREKEKCMTCIFVKNEIQCCIKMDRILEIKNNCWNDHNWRKKVTTENWGRAALIFNSCPPCPQKPKKFTSTVVFLYFMWERIWQYSFVVQFKGHSNIVIYLCTKILILGTSSKIHWKSFWKSFLALSYKLQTSKMFTQHRFTQTLE